MSEGYDPVFVVPLILVVGSWDVDKAIGPLVRESLEE